VGKPVGRIPLGKPILRWGVILIRIFRKWYLSVWMDRAGSGSGQLAGTCKCSNEHSGSVKRGVFLD
jgi:hypothetical protein